MRQFLDKAGPLIAAMPPGYFALVMSTGIISIACHLLGFWFLAIPLFWLTLAFYLILWLLTLWRLFCYPRQFLSDFTDDTRGVEFFTVIAGTCILGNQWVLFLGAYRIAVTSINWPSVVELPDHMSEIVSPNPHLQPGAFSICPHLLLHKTATEKVW